MKKPFIWLFAAASLVALVQTVVAGSVLLKEIEIAVDSATSVTGEQSNTLENARLHLLSRTNPHEVTAEQVGAVTPVAMAVATGNVYQAAVDTSSQHVERVVGDLTYVESVNGESGQVTITAAGLGALTAEQDLMALAALSTNRVTILHDSQSASYFQTLVNGTGTVWEVYLATNLMVAISPDFDAAGVRPDWSTNVFPFVDGYWGSDLVDSGDGYYDLWIGHNEEPYAAWAGDTIGGFPVLLTSIGGNAIGTAIVYKTFTAITNLYATFATAAERQAIEERLSILEADTLHPSEIIEFVNPRAVTLYGSNSITNETGFGAFLSTNNAENVNITAVDPVAGQLIAAYQYRVASGRLYGTATLSHHLTTGSGTGTISSVATVVQTISPSGVSLSSNTVATFTVAAGLLVNTNIVASFAIPSVESNGVIRVSIVETIGSVRDVTAYSGRAKPMTLTLQSAPIDYATVDELEAFTPTYIGVATATAISVSAGSYYIDLTEWAATGMTWAAGIDWPVTPDMTMTGRYEFAFSTLGTKLQGRQVYPTMTCETGFLIGSRNNNLAASPLVYQSWSTASSTNDYVMVAVSLNPTRYLRGRLFYDFVTDLAATNPASFYGGWGGLQALPNQATLTTLALDRPVYAASTPDPRKYIDFVMEPRATAEISSSYLYLYARKPYAQGGFAITGIRLCPLDELRINAYKAGWRP